MVNKRMKFKPVRQSNAVFVLIIDIFFGGLATMILFLSDYPKIIIPCVWAAFALPLVYCLSYSKKLKTFKQNGICIPGCIIGVYEQISSSAPNVYYLKIVFFEDGDKELCSQGYYKDPNRTLADTKCNVYKWKGKYLEADFNTLCKGDHPKVKIDPYTLGPFFSFKIGKVTEGKK